MTFKYSGLLFLVLSEQRNVQFNLYVLDISIQGGPVLKNATLTINNFKKTRDRMKKLCALLHIKLFFHQDDMKIVNLMKAF